MQDKKVIDDIREKSDIVQVVSEYVPLKKRGRNYLGLCPFHSEKTASFTVSPEKQLFHCFGCGEGGNVFSFLMKIENIGFGEALQELGSKAGISVARSATSTSPSEKNRIYEANQLAANFFMAQLKTPAGEQARAYLVQRKIGDKIAKNFGLGFAPAAWDNLFKFLIARGVAPKVIEQAGLVLAREGGDGFYDRFRSRLIFPILDIRGRVIAFSGRALDNAEPKYLNSPDTPIYRKGDSIFGLGTTKDEIKKDKTAVLVEGNIDLLSAYQAGAMNVAAPLGTALTANQCKLLARFAETVIVAFDADAAGEAASERSAEILRSQGLQVRVAEWHEAKDPDELIQKAGSAAFQKALQSALPFVEYKIKRVFFRHNLATIDGRASALRECAKILGGEADPFAQKEYAKLAAGHLKTDTETIMAEINRQGFYRQSSSQDLRRVTEKPASKVDEAERKLIALAAQDESALATIKQELGTKDFSHPEARNLAAMLFAGQFTGIDGLAEPAKNYLTGALIGTEIENPATALQDCIGVIKSAALKGNIDALKVLLREAEKTKDEPKIAELVSEISRISVR